MKSFRRYITEATVKSALIVYPGRFQPMHLGHYMTWKNLVNEAGSKNVLMATTNDQSSEKSPLTFEQKKEIMRLIDPEIRLKEVGRTYNDAEYHEELGDPTLRGLIFVVSKKDIDRFHFGVKKNGDPTYLRPFVGGVDIAPASSHGYIRFVETVNLGDSALGATQLRAFALEDNFERFREGLPSHVSEENALDIFNILKTAMGKKASLQKNERRDDSFLEAGAIVRLKETSEKVKIQFVGANYLILETSSGKKRVWPNQVEEIND